MMRARSSVFANSMAVFAASAAIAWSVAVETEPFSVRVTTRKVTAMKVMTERRMRVMTRATPRSALRKHEDGGWRMEDGEGEMRGRGGWRMEDGGWKGAERNLEP